MLHHRIEDRFVGDGLEGASLNVVRLRDVAELEQPPDCREVRALRVVDELRFDQRELGMPDSLVQQFGAALFPVTIRYERLDATREMIKYFDYLSGGYSGTGAGYPGAFGFLIALVVMGAPVLYQEGAGGARDSVTRFAIFWNPSINAPSSMTSIFRRSSLLATASNARRPPAPAGLRTSIRDALGHMHVARLALGLPLRVAEKSLAPNASSIVSAASSALFIAK